MGPGRGRVPWDVKREKERQRKTERELRARTRIIYFCPILHSRTILFHLVYELRTNPQQNNNATHTYTHTREFYSRKKPLVSLVPSHNQFFLFLHCCRDLSIQFHQWIFYHPFTNTIINVVHQSLKRNSNW